MIIIIIIIGGVIIVRLKAYKNKEKTQQAKEPWSSNSTIRVTLKALYILI
jgi:hypothetical protein